MLENFNMDFSKNIFISSEKETWVDSPSNMVKRIPLEREAAESGHTTSIVRYAPGASFPQHSHPLGEEIFVLEGMFSDEKGNYPAGTYIRNPAGTSHSPFSKEGCLLFVKLNQFAKDDLESVLINTKDRDWHQGHGNLQVMPLHSFGTQGTALVKWPAGEKFVPHTHMGGEEILVLSGEFKDEHGSYPKGCWVRSGHMSTHHPWVDEETIILVKTGHLLV